ncbi:MAG: anthranilate phosphoribosyltransferase [Pseudomonadota bacterium]
MIQSALGKVVDRENLTEQEMVEVMDQITEGRATPAQIGAFMIGLRMKGESVDEITGAARVMRAKSVKIPVGTTPVSVDRDEINLDNETVVDTCGTGGDGTHTFNVSTTTAFVVAGGGLKVAKHGNRSVSSLCGSADVVERLGVRLDIAPEHVAECIDTVGIGFLYAPMLHGAMRHVVRPRREIGLRSIFNLLGPLTNPAGASVQVLGVYNKALTQPMAKVLQRLGCKSAFVVHGAGCYDEISITGPTFMTRVNEDSIETLEFVPEDVGIRRAQPSDIRGGDSEKNAAVTMSVLKGELGPCRDMVVLNAAAVFVAARMAAGMAEGVALATESIDSGRALKKLEGLVEISSRSMEAETSAAVR